MFRRDEVTGADRRSLKHIPVALQFPAAAREGAGGRSRVFFGISRIVKNDRARLERRREERRETNRLRRGAIGKQDS